MNNTRDLLAAIKEVSLMCSRPPFFFVATIGNLENCTRSRQSNRLQDWARVQKYEFHYDLTEVDDNIIYV